MQLPNGPFGPIPVQVVLDGSGNGTVTFQPNGKNARITNLMVKVSTTTNQATCTIYLGQISDSNIIMNTNSGSTGAPGSGRIDILDGQTLYVRWTGGDAGATATATFVGTTVPFGEVGTSDFEWDNPIAAGDGSLIYPALRSPNYVEDVSGWKIGRDGSVEFSNAVIRGTIEAGNGLVTLTTAGVKVEDATHYHMINYSGGFLSKKKPFDNSYITMQCSSLTDFIGVGLRPENPSIINGLDIGEAQVQTYVNESGTEESPALLIRAPLFTGVPVQAYMILYGQSSTGTLPHIEVSAERMHDPFGRDYFRGQHGSVSLGVMAAMVAGAGTTYGPFNFPVAFPAGVTPQVFANLTTGAGGAAMLVSRALSITNTGFSVRINATAAYGGGFTGTVDYIAVYP